MKIDQELVKVMEKEISKVLKVQASLIFEELEEMSFMDSTVWLMQKEYKNLKKKWISKKYEK